MVGLNQYTDEEIYFVLWYKVLGEHTKRETLAAFKTIFGTDITDSQLRYLGSKYEYEPRFNAPRANGRLIENPYWTERVVDWTRRLGIAPSSVRPIPPRKDMSTSTRKGRKLKVRNAPPPRFGFANPAVASAFNLNHSIRPSTATGSCMGSGAAQDVARGSGVGTGEASYHNVSGIPSFATTFPFGAPDSPYGNRTPRTLPAGATCDAVNGYPIAPNVGTSRHPDHQAIVARYARNGGYDAEPQRLSTRINGHDHNDAALRGLDIQDARRDQFVEPESTSFYRPGTALNSPLSRLVDQGSLVTRSTLSAAPSGRMRGGDPGASSSVLSNNPSSSSLFVQEGTLRFAEDHANPSPKVSSTSAFAGHGVKQAPVAAISVGGSTGRDTAAGRPEIARSPLTANIPSTGLLQSDNFFDSVAKYFGLEVGSSRVDLQACKLEYSIVSPK